MDWFYISNGKEFGPITPEELRDYISTKSIPTDKFRSSGMTEWVFASEINSIQDKSAAQHSTISTPIGPSEGSIAKFIGNAIIWLSLISATICVIAFGRTEVPDGLYSTTTRWNSLLITIFIASGLNGAFFGYLLAKVGSVLKRLESSQPPV